MTAPNRPAEMSSFRAAAEHATQANDDATAALREALQAEAAAVRDYLGALGRGVVPGSLEHRGLQEALAAAAHRRRLAHATVDSTRGQALAALGAWDAELYRAALLAQLGREVTP
jgi:hypothetical protein